jgi:hypothetical protein
MKRQNALRCWSGAILVVAFVLWNVPSAESQRVLLHGGNVDATNGDDGAVLSHLQSLYGAGNVTYMQGAMAAGDGSSALGFDAVVISSTLDSGTVRSKYDDIAIGVLQWEQALVHDDTAGNFFLSDGGADVGASTTQIDIVDPNHPIAGGLSGTIDVFNMQQPTMVGTGAVGPGVTVVANRTADANHHAILAADIGDELRGGMIAPGRRVHFFLQNVGFADLTADGLQLFDNAMAYVVEPVPVPIGGVGTMGNMELPLGRLDLETTQQGTSVPGLTMDVYRNVTLASPEDWALHLSATPAPVATGTVPRINWDEVPAEAAEFAAPNSYAEAQPILDADLANAGDAASPNFSNYSVRMTGEIQIPASTVRFKDGNDDYTYLAIDLDGSGQIDSGEVLINDNNWAPWDGADIVDGDPASPIVTADFTGSLTGEDAWRKVEFRMAEGTGGDNAALFWDQNELGFFPDENTIGLSEFELVPEDNFRTFQQELVSATIVSTFDRTAIFDVFVEQLDWDRLSMPGEAGGRLELDGAEFQINVLDPENLESGFTIDIIRDENIGEISGTPTFSFLNTDAEDWDLSMFNVNGQLTFTGGGAPGIPGDYNNSGLVEQGDLDLVLGFWGAEAGDVPATWENDPPVGFVDQAELDKVLGNWGMQAPGLGNTAGVPEPSTLVLLLVGAAALGLATWRRR